MRLVHLPVSIVAPPKSWQVGEIITEMFEFELPDDTTAGSYALAVGWYDADHIFGAHTDERSRLGEEVTVGQLVIP